MSLAVGSPCGIVVDDAGILADQGEHGPADGIGQRRPRGNHRPPDLSSGGPVGLLPRPVAADNAAMEVEPKRKRRWFQFSLRTLLIGVTLVAVACGYVGRQVAIVKAREAMAAAPGVDSVVAAAPRDIITSLSSGSEVVHVTSDSRESVPWFRSWLGDRYYLGLSVDKSASDDEIARYKQAFPEATIMRRASGGVMELWRRVTQPAVLTHRHTRRTLQTPVNRMPGR